MTPPVEISKARVDAVIFDMDGVVTRTATVHAAAWKQLFDEYLKSREERGEAPQREFAIDEDYRQYVDGRPRYDGVEAFLRSRGITLPRGSPGDSPEEETVCGLGNRKDRYFLDRIKKDGVQAFPSTVSLIVRLKDLGIRSGIFSASRNAETILQAAGVLDLFRERVDGIDAEELGLPGKPDPAMLLELTRRLGTVPSRTAVVEDAIAGVRAGRSGRFALVIGVNRSGQRGVLRKNGADVEVADLREVSVKGT